VGLGSNGRSALGRAMVPLGATDKIKIDSLANEDNLRRGALCRAYYSESV
jgi:hypothetical protein